MARKFLMQKLFYLLPFSIYMVTDFLQAWSLYQYVYIDGDLESVSDKMKPYYYLSFIGMLSLLPLIYSNNLIGLVPGYLA